MRLYPQAIQLKILSQSYNSLPEASQSVIQQLHSEMFLNLGIELSIKRDDLIHPEISGNKWRKLKYNLMQVQELKLPALLTFGGAYSNHIAATAALGRIYNIETIGVIRGDENAIKNNYVIKKAEEDGMKMHFISRSQYRNKSEKEFLQKLKIQFGDFHHVPEGGANYLGVCGCAEILDQNTNDFDIICVSSGTATTAAGIGLSLKAHQELWVFPAINDVDDVKNRLKKSLEYALFDSKKMNDCLAQIHWKNGFQFGGFGKINAHLYNFYKQFLTDYKIELDLIYTAKMMFGLFEIIKNQSAMKGKRILAVHTGGLQGNQGLKSNIEKLNHEKN